MVLPLIPVNRSGAGRFWEPAPLDSGFHHQRRLPCTLTTPPSRRGRAQVWEAWDKHLGPRAPLPLLWNPAWSLKFSTLSLWLQTLELLQFPDLKTAPPSYTAHRVRQVLWVGHLSRGTWSPDCWEQSLGLQP